MSQVVQVGLSHPSAPLCWRERLAIASRAAGAEAAEVVGTAAAAEEALVLSTCQRVEAYAVGPDADRLESDLVERMARRAGCPVGELANIVEVRRGADAVRHLMRTAAGLASPVLGEPEILGQLRHAHRRAAEAGATGPVLERLVTDALRAGRRVRSETGLASGTASLTSTVVTLARELVGGRRALVIGSTRTARAAAERLRGDGWDVSTGEQPASTFDVIVACAGGSAGIGRETLRASMPRLVVDLSVPRDVDPAVRDLPGVRLYDVDDVARAAQQALAVRRMHVPAAEAVVEEELRRFESWRATRSLVPTIKALREQQRRAVAELLGELPDELVERLVTRLVHAPTARLREAAVSGDGERWAEATRELFGLGPATRSQAA